MYDISILVDTHSTKEVEHIWQAEWGFKAKFSSGTSASRGVAILFKNSFSFDIINTVSDENGNFIILDIRIQGQQITLCALYGPNEDNPNFFNTISQIIDNMNNLSVIMVGDWNVVMEYEKDNLNYKHKNNPKAQTQIHEIMTNLNLIDIWREKNEDKRRYTWIGPHNKQSRLDYFLISTDIAQYVEEADIGIRYKSDHNPISVKFKFVQQERGRGNWKFNNNLLGDIEYVDLIKTCISETVNQYKVNNLNQENTEPTLLQFSINDQLFWETLKLMIRGKTISYSTYKKRSQNEREKQINEKLIQLYQNFEANREEIGQLSTELSQIREDRIKGILLRAKVRWKVEGEKSTRYFCNLEKRHFSEKTIPKLIVENKEISDQMAIISEQEKFYKQLYSTKNTTITAEDKTIFFNSDNPFITVLNENEKQSLEGPLTPTEALKSLKEMKNNKSPGIDGFTVEFYKFFWIDLGIYLVRTLNYAYTTQNLSISQKQGIITCIPKEGKSKEYLKNWRPISLLSVDLKIGSASIAARIKKVLTKLISESQSGFIKGRYIGDCNRLVFDLIEKTKRENIPGLLVLLDFEKAFDSLEWNFIENALSFFGFGESIIQWFKTFYTDISSYILYNGHLSDVFKIQRGVRQGDPLSPYLFILCVELLSASLKAHPDIQGLEINNTEYLISQYADDSTLIFGEDEVSLNTALDIVDKFAGCSGLRANFDKTQVLWFGAKRGCGEELRTQKPIIWNHGGKFKLLGIEFDVNNEDVTGINFPKKLESVKKLLNDWSFRSLSLLGKICVVKTLAMPILIQIFTVLPTPPDNFLKDLEKMFFSFIWDKKGDRIKRNVIINSKNEGGLQMPHVPSFCAALKMSWLKKVLDVNYITPWKSLLLDTMERYGGDKMLYLPKEGILTLLHYFNSFWKSTLEVWANLVRYPPTTPDEVMSQCIWLNNNIKCNGRKVILPHWIQKGIYFIQDLMTNDGRFFSFAEFRNTYLLDINFVEYYGMIDAIPLEWKRLIRNHIKTQTIIQPYVRLLKSCEKSTKPFYQILLKKVSNRNIKAITKWQTDLNLEENENWNQYFSMLYHTTDDAKLLNFHYKLFHRIIYTNSKLFKCKMIETELCTFCNEQKETLMHLFFDCCHVRTFLLQLFEEISVKCNIHYLMTPDTWILNKFTGSPIEIDCLTICAILAKYYIYCCKIKKCMPNITSFKQRIKVYSSIELYSKYMYTEKKAGKFTARWSCLKQILDNS